MNRADRMLEVLQDGRWHSRDEILTLAGRPFFLANNAASDLRKRGVNITHQVRDGLHCYRLAGSLNTDTDQLPSLASPSVSVLSEPLSNPGRRTDVTESLGAGATGDGGRLALFNPDGLVAA